MGYLKRYKNRQIQNAYENACDCLYFGLSPKDWEDCGIEHSKRKEVWAVAWYDMGDGFEENGHKPIQTVLREVFQFTN